MNSGFSDFQDLLNVTTSGQDIDDLQTELKNLEEVVADNTTDISSNLLAINNNTTAISNNLVLINNNTGNIATNTSNLALETFRITVNANEILQHDGEINTLQLDRISDLARITTNEQGIQTNTIALTTLGNDVLRKDGSVLLDVGYMPTQSQSIATKTYVDNSIGGSTQFLKIDGSNSMTGDLELNGNDLKIDGNTSKLYIENSSNNLVMASQNNLMFVRAGAIDAEVTAAGINMYKRLDMGQQNITNAALINGYNLSTFNSDIVTNTGNIATNTNAISVNAGNIAVNTSAISTNAGNIAANTSAISTKLPLAGGTMTGAINMDNNGIFNVSYLSSYGDITTNNYIKTNLLFPVSGNDIFIPGSAGIRPAFIQSNFGTNSLLCKSDLDLQSNDITNVGLVDGFDLNTFDSNITTLAANLGNETVARISADAALAGDIATNLGNINSNYGLILANQNNIGTNATAISTKLPSSGSSITATTPFFKIDGGNSSCELRICADSGNDNEAFNPKIVFQQDGSVQTGAVFLKNNTLNLSSAATGVAGIIFRTSTTNNGWETAPIRMTIKTNGDVEYEHSIRIKSTNEFEFGYGVANKNQYSGRCTYKGFSGYALDFVGAAVGAADRQVQIYEDLTLKAVIQTSDERLKHHIRPIEIKMAGALIDSLQPKCFMWKNIDRLTGEVRDFTDHHCYMGLIAQEVKATQDTIGDAMGEKLRISRNPKNEHDYMSVAYTQLIAPMMKCIQDLRARVAVLESK